MKITDAPVASTGMLIRKRVAEVFEAFVDPAITAHFCSTRGSTRLQAGARVRWDSERDGHSTQVDATAFERNRRRNYAATPAWQRARESVQEPCRKSRPNVG